MDAADQAAQESLLAAVAEARRALRGQVFALQASCQHFHGVNPHRRGEFRLARARADVHQQTARSPLVSSWRWPRGSTMRSARNSRCLPRIRPPADIMRTPCRCTDGARRARAPPQVARRCSTVFSATLYGAAAVPRLTPLVHQYLAGQVPLPCPPASPSPPPGPAIAPTTGARYERSRAGRDRTGKRGRAAAWPT